MNEDIDTLTLVVKRRWWFSIAKRALIAYVRITDRMPPEWAIPALVRHGLRIEVAA